MRKDAIVPVTGTGAFVRHHPGKYLVGDQRKAGYRDTQIADRLAGSGRPAAPARSAVKRSFDAALATLGMLVLLPGLLLIALAIKLSSPGPILFRQRRYGRDNEMFLIYKFRTMYIDKGDDTGVKQTHRSDQRVTPVGKFLRRSSLDELPQLLNVVRGDMSLVGPRPHVPGMLAAGVPYEILVPNYFERHRVRPGITGLAQARGLRGSTVDADLAKARIDLDLKYIHNWSFALDVRIIIETVWTEFLKAGNGH
jgi:polysaccharide biosynthesis protein PslA